MRSWGETSAVVEENAPVGREEEAITVKVGEEVDRSEKTPSMGLSRRNGWLEVMREGLGVL